MVRKICEHYGYTPNQVADMTMQQVRLLSCDDKELGGIVKMSPHEARRMGFI